MNLDAHPVYVLIKIALKIGAFLFGRRGKGKR
jgi:hypothetical protein